MSTSFNVRVQEIPTKKYFMIVDGIQRPHSILCETKGEAWKSAISFSKSRLIKSSAKLITKKLLKDAGCFCVKCRIVPIGLYEK